MSDPALLFHDTADRAGTHVLLIGIGAYPYLEGGSDYHALEHEETAMGMGQLNAPPLSMRQTADWFLSDYSNPDRELSSVALILSEEDEQPYTHERMEGAERIVPRGSVKDVHKAVVGWLRRASGRRDNSLIFGFCGHGIQSGNPVLLCRDYGEIPESRFQGAIDFEQFRIALSTMLPDTQLFFIDACRTPANDDSVLGQTTPGNSLLDPLSLDRRDNIPAAQSVQFATSLYTESWGRTEGASLFTEALLKALRGGGAEQTQDWWVTTGRLHSVLSTYLLRLSAAENVIQRPASHSEDFRICKPGPIPVELYVRSDEPGIWRGKLSIEAASASFSYRFEHAPGDPPDETVDHCKLDLINQTQKFADVSYKINALFPPDSPYLDYAEDIVAYPPETTFSLPVSKRS